jgi:tetratricopeptide (TPR) repeat protein
MNWKKQLYALEQHKEWDMAIELMEQVIKDNPDDVDAYLLFIYFFMNLLVEECEYDTTKHDHYVQLAIHYFQESYKKFSNNAAYLFFAARATYPAPWLFGTTDEVLNEMIQKAIQLDPTNPIYQWNSRKTFNTQRAIAYFQSVLDPNFYIQKTLTNKGSLGHYLLDIMTNVSKEMLDVLIHGEKQLQILEEKRQWSSVIALIDNMLSYSTDTKTLIVRKYYYILCLLVDNTYQSKEDFPGWPLQQEVSSLYKQYCNELPALFFISFTDCVYAWAFRDYMMFYGSKLYTPEATNQAYTHLEQAIIHAPNNVLDQWANENHYQKKQALLYARTILDPQIPVASTLATYNKTASKKLLAWAKEIVKKQ